jgi:hypothetical protein
MTNDPCRQAFENWFAEPGCMSIARKGEWYTLMQTNQAWIAWKAGWEARQGPNKSGSPSVE